MSRRPLVATIVTTGVGGLLGALLGAVIGRIIYSVGGDPTIQSSVPMAFCATLGLFVGAPAAAKGSLERFGAARSTAGTAIAAAIIIVLFGFLNVGTSVGKVVLFPAALIIMVAAAVAATAIGQPQDKPVPNVMGTARPAPQQPTDTQAGALAAPFMVNEPAPPKPRASEAARRVPGKPADDWTEDLYEPRPMPVVDPASGRELGGTPSRRREPLRAAREPASETTAEPAAEEPPARPRRERPLRRGDA